eukprot:CAMPEP_0178968724 /NCGR_PEP_ID=MMETSP0789-20121207/18429_1 /TAXON_ID=3005 /ORGANISM="Rhizosolenia setigera, Strain CCMP 1694" /LENGTH=229 /DNA_ID=CAMNT_0020654717 /DNA_START=249 /DNA_END=938 /DNA_ORIENTATION=+
MSSKINETTITTNSTIDTEETHFCRKRKAAATEVSNNGQGGKKRTKNCEMIETTNNNTPEYQRLSALSPIDHLKAVLKKGCKKEKGWHRAEYGLNDAKKVHLNEREKVQLLYEYDLLQQHLKDTQSMKHDTRNKKTGRFDKNSKRKQDPITLTNLYHVWGISKQTMALTRKRRALKKNNLSEHHQFLSIVSPEKVEEERPKRIRRRDNKTIKAPATTLPLPDDINIENI